MAQVGEQKKVTSEAVEEFKVLYLDQFGTQLCDEEATEKASTLLNLYRMIYSFQGDEAGGIGSDPRKATTGGSPLAPGEERT